MATVHDFVSPFDLKNCKTRLDRRTEKTSILASKYAERIKVDVWDINRITTGFKVYKAPRSSLQLSFGWFSLQVTGKLQARPDGGTVVVYQVWQNPIGMVLEWVGALLLGILAVLIFYPQWYDSFLHPVAFVVFIVATGLAVGATYFYRQFTRNDLIAVVRQSLGDLDTELMDSRKEKPRKRG
jgi:hypothetical protein